MGRVDAGPVGGRGARLAGPVDQQGERHLARPGAQIQLDVAGRGVSRPGLEDDIAEVVAKWTGIPVSRLMEGEMEKLLHMEERLHQRVVGQDQAVEAVANALRRARSDLGAV